MSINFSPKSILGFGTAISLIAYFGGTAIDQPQLTQAAKPFVILFVGIWLIYVVFGLINLGQSTFG